LEIFECTTGGGAFSSLESDFYGLNSIESSIYKGYFHIIA